MLEKRGDSDTTPAGSATDSIEEALPTVRIKAQYFYFHTPVTG